MQNKPDLQTLLRMKRHETPGPEYFENMLGEFHRRQREELLRKSAWMIWKDQTEAFFASIRESVASVVLSPKTALAGAAAAIVLAAVMLPKSQETVTTLAQAKPIAPVVEFDNRPASIFFSNDGIAADLKSPLLPVRQGGLVFDNDLVGVPALTASNRVAPHHYVAEGLPTGSIAARVSF